MTLLEFTNEVNRHPSASELSILQRIISSRLKQISASSIFSFRSGDLVEFSSTKTGTCQGTVKKVKRVKLLIDCGNKGKWNVPANLCKKLNE